MWNRDFYPRSKPRAVRGGIRAQSKGFGKSWWAQRWISVLESFDIGARLGRGRSYARNGQVLSIKIAKGKVKAKVQGSRPTPYDITIQATVLTEQDWDKLLCALAGQALFTAKLLTGEMPQDIERAFEAVGLALFPKTQGDLRTNCSCPDWSNPCKHVAAVYYLLGEEFDRDPFMLFQLRGLSREELLSRLDQASGERQQEGVANAASDAALPSEPLPMSSGGFWSMGELPPELFGEVAPPPVAAAWPKRLGNFPFWRGTVRFMAVLEETYRAASQRGLEAFRGTVGAASSQGARDMLE